MAKLIVGDIVLIKRGLTAKYGKILKCWARERAQNQYRLEYWYMVKFIVPETGELLKCPDARCDEGCVICTTQGWADDFHKCNPDELKLFVESGMLNPELIENETKPLDKRIPKNKSSRVSNPPRTSTSRKKGGIGSSSG